MSEYEKLLALIYEQSEELNSGAELALGDFINAFTRTAASISSSRWFQIRIQKIQVRDQSVIVGKIQLDLYYKNPRRKPKLDLRYHLRKTVAEMTEYFKMLSNRYAEKVA